MSLSGLGRPSRLFDNRISTMMRPEIESDHSAAAGILNHRVAVIVVAAGSGSRMGGTLPKQYCRLGGTPVLARTLACFLEHPAVDRVQPVISPEAETHYKSAIAGLSESTRLLTPVAGGMTRQASVRAGLQALFENPPQFVLITDAARPFVSAALIDRLLAALASGDEAAIPAIPVVDTLKKSSGDNLVEATVPRENLHRVQTPQAFRFETILEAHRDHQEASLTDDAAVAEQAGIVIRLVDGDPKNVKLTHPEDLKMAEAALRTPRTGSGFDVHRLEDGAGVTLCGVFIKHDKALSGHSDADVGLHALTDALLGAIGDGDIGDHFPPADPKWKGADSAQFLAHAASLVADRGGSITHVDVTLVCERPRIGAHKMAMKQRIADILDIGVDRVSVKATTTEKLGFTGRGEGIAAQAMATVLV